MFLYICRTLGSSQLADHLVNEINQGQCYVKNFNNFLTILLLSVSIKGTEKQIWFVDLFVKWYMEGALFAHMYYTITLQSLLDLETHNLKYWKWKFSQRFCEKFFILLWIVLHLKTSTTQIVLEMWLN